MPNEEKTSNEIGIGDWELGFRNWEFGIGNLENQNIDKLVQPIKY